jgi:molybdate transport system substrate-binding protein
MKKWIVLLLSLLLVSCSNSSKEKVTLTISAAASMKDVLTPIKEQYEAKHPSVQLSFNFASSGTLQKQIEQGAPVDLFISAATEPFQQLKNKELIVHQPSDHLVYNELVLITSNTLRESIHSLHDLTHESIKTIAIGIPETVPAGAYAKKWLESEKMWDTLTNKFVFAKDVRQVLTYVESGNAEAGIVYRTDALTSKHVHISAEAGHSLKEQIVYEAGVIQSSSHKKEAIQFLQYLYSDTAKKLFQEFGFKVKEEQ